MLNFDLDLKVEKIKIKVKMKLGNASHMRVLKRFGGGSTRLVPSIATSPPRRVPQHCAKDLETTILFVRDEERRQEMVAGAQQSRILKSHCLWYNAVDA